MKGYKVFNSDWTCRGFQYEVGKTYEMDEKPICCNRGFHFCKKASDCFQYYSFDPDNKVAEVEALGDIDTNKDDSKCSTNKIHIIREITWQEVLDLVNLGKGCTGFCNSGNRNSGDHNSGYHNSGDFNSGDSNSGDFNSGNRNTGDWNSGYHNSGDFNTGNRNSGYRNSGNCNSGDFNSGDWNSGNWNSGDFNSGDFNTGNWNSGNRNSGDFNSGDWNSGLCNSGNWNRGDLNKTSNAVGCFNTQDRQLFFFDKPTDITFKQWRNSEAYCLLAKSDLRPIVWIPLEDMTELEKKQYPEAYTTGGYLKVRNNNDRFIEWWNNLTDEEKDIIKSIPNFDPDKFFEITGIIVED